MSARLLVSRLEGVDGAGEDFFTVGSIWANIFPPNGEAALGWESGSLLFPMVNFSSGVLLPDRSGVFERSLMGVLEPALSGVLEPALSGVLDPDLSGVLDPGVSGVFEPVPFGVLEPFLSNVLEPGFSETVFGALFSEEFFRV